MLKAPAGYERALRRRLDDPTLTLWFNQQESEGQGGQVWHVLSIQRGGWHTVCTWEHPLDGNLDAICNKVARHDYLKNGGKRKFADSFMAGRVRQEQEKRRRFRDWASGVADYSRDAFRAMAYGEPSVGAR
jgi:hypothetical protein